MLAAHKRDTKPEWAAQFRGERDGARERMERCVCHCQQARPGGAVGTVKPGSWRQAGAVKGRAGVRNVACAGVVQGEMQRAGRASAGEWWKIREAWTQVGREKVLELGKDVVPVQRRRKNRGLSGWTGRRQSVRPRHYCI